MENSEEKDDDSGYEDPCYIANEYREERIFEDKFYDPMIEELFSAAKEDQAYQKVLAEVKKGLTKDALKLLPPDHPAWAMTQQWGEIGVMRRHQDGLLVYQVSRKKIKEFLHLPHLGQRLTYQAGALCCWWPGGFREEIFKLMAECQTCTIYSPSRQREEEAEEKWMDEEIQKSPNTHHVTEALKKIFLTWGCLKHLKTDSGGHYRSEFKQYCANMYITPHTTSGYKPRSNGDGRKRGIENQITSQENGTYKR